ncbi:hypothetical protein Agub_g12503 [Astrephomene gubernaculifera]|uniref:Uncharacterized protein n=1 Tax=Astrephomene gubernaculifera TaxID=47775 RepID=A0AAD3DYD9_9CHLO|nr:hypothetical protein Agub_g12503 [Astrephomene gubernaculifera]
MVLRDSERPAKKERKEAGKPAASDVPGCITGPLTLLFGSIKKHGDASSLNKAFALVLASAGYQWADVNSVKSGKVQTEKAGSIDVVRYVKTWTYNLVERVGGAEAKQLYRSGDQKICDAVERRCMELIKNAMQNYQGAVAQRKANMQPFKVPHPVEDPAVDKDAVVKNTKALPDLASERLHSEQQQAAARRRSVLSAQWSQQQTAGMSVKTTTRKGAGSQHDGLAGAAVDGSMTGSSPGGSAADKGNEEGRQLPVHGKQNTARPPAKPSASGVRQKAGDKRPELEHETAQRTSRPRRT